jgi:hypothetical protein
MLSRAPLSITVTFFSTALRNSIAAASSSFGTPSMKPRLAAP